MENEDSLKLKQHMEKQRGSAIINETQNGFRQDGYSNMLNKYGTTQDNSTAYQYNAEPFADDMELTRLYEGNGLFAKIIDRPSEEAVKHGLDIDFGDKDVAEYVDERLDDLDFEEKFATAEKWARLYGGAIIVMLVDDGGGLDDPLDFRNARSIEELMVFERAVVQPDYTALYNFNFIDPSRRHASLGEPEYYMVFSTYGYFRVHRSRCLVFRNGRLPEQTSNALYRFWGVPEYVRIKRALRECITSHEDGVKLLERSVQAIYKMKNLANLLSTEDGENKAIQRLQVIDMARGILNSIAIDVDGEDYDFKTLQMSGVKDVIDATCNMLSAVTNIPQTILFGRSPSGMNSTGESDMENYYNMVENIQKQNMKKNARTVIELVLKHGKLDGSISDAPKFKMKFAALWSTSETEQAEVDNKNANTDLIKAQTAQLYMDGNVLDPAEVRNALANEGKFDIYEVLSDDQLDVPYDLFDIKPNSVIGISSTDMPNNDAENSEIRPGTITVKLEDNKKQPATINVRMDGEDTDFGAAVLVVKDGKILVADRGDGEGLCGPGGHIQDDETVEAAVVREAQEEFGIVPLNILPLGYYQGSPGRYSPSIMYFTDQFEGTPTPDDDEMKNARWMTLEELENADLFPPFEESVKMLINLLTARHPTATITSEDGGSGSGNFGHGGRKGQIGGSSPTASATGENEPCKGFAKGRAKAHFDKHGVEVGCSTKDEYVAKAKDFIKQKCGGDVDGYATKDGYFCRFNRKTCEYGKGQPGGTISTYFVSKYNKKTGEPNTEAANKYFDKLKSMEGSSDEKT